MRRYVDLIIKAGSVISLAADLHVDTVVCIGEGIVTLNEGTIYVKEGYFWQSHGRLCGQYTHESQYERIRRKVKLKKWKPQTSFNSDWDRDNVNIRIK